MFVGRAIAPPSPFLPHEPIELKLAAFASSQSDGAQRSPGPSPHLQLSFNFGVIQKVFT